METAEMVTMGTVSATETAEQTTEDPSQQTIRETELTGTLTHSGITYPVITGGCPLVLRRRLALRG